TDILVEQLKDREKEQIELFAKTLEYTINEDLGSNIHFITEEVLFQNKSIPTILTDENGTILQYRNIEIDSIKNSIRQISAKLNSILEEMATTYNPIPVGVRDPRGKEEIYGYIYYNNSFLLAQLTYYPYIQLSVIAVFGFIAYLAFNYSKAAEQNRVWVGLAKETAHQLGTPISSLMAWMEFIREDPEIKNKNIAIELDKDIQRLTLITERFSSIGSTPVLKKENVYSLLNNSINYLRPRISSKVNINLTTLSDNIDAMVNPPLFDWVIENLCKNSVDAMSGSGQINIQILRGSEKKVLIDITDNGKGIPKSKINDVFNPGFTTKKRGWGLGLALAKRIVENYHNGKIYVKNSEEDKGTTFRIVLPAL
ncbi:MAG: HAMP domain-containing histidine kinase, partial [Cyclobacteriaceae bacterium]|nr:HAMP domain-containing histidine kinase [Cyclobacteriaceae bacterium]